MNDLIISERKKFIDSIKFEEDADLKLLKQIQNEISMNVTNIDRVVEITKKLSESQKQKLSNLYKEQINQLKQDINTCKNKIMNIRKSAYKK